MLGNYNYHERSRERAIYIYISGDAYPVLYTQKILESNLNDSIEGERDSSPSTLSCAIEFF